MILSMELINFKNNKSLIFLQCSRPMSLLTNGLIRPLSKGGGCNINNYHIANWCKCGEFFSLYIYVPTP